MAYDISYETTSQRATRLKAEGRWAEFKARKLEIGYNAAAKEFPPLASGAAPEPSPTPSSPAPISGGPGEPSLEAAVPRTPEAPDVEDAHIEYGDVSQGELARAINWTSQALGLKKTPKAPNLLCASLYRTYRSNPGEFFKTLFSRLVPTKLEVEDIGDVNRDKARDMTGIEEQILAAARENGAVNEENELAVAGETW